MKLLLNIIILFSFIAVYEQCAKTKKNFREVDIDYVIESDSDTIGMLIRESIESLFIHYLKYPNNKKELIDFILKGDRDALKYYDNLINYKSNIIFVNDSFNNYLTVKYDNKTINIPKYDICENISSTLPSSILLNKVIFYRKTNYLFDNVEEEILNKAFFLRMKLAKENILYEYEKPLQYKYFKFSKNNLKFKCKNSNQMSLMNRRYLKQISGELDVFLKDFSVDSLLFTIPLGN